MTLLDEKTVETEDGYLVTPFEDGAGWLLRDLITDKEFCLSPSVVDSVTGETIPDHVDPEDVEECAQLLRVRERRSGGRGESDREDAYGAGAATLERALAPEGGDDGA